MNSNVKKMPRGIRNNNPGNIEMGKDKWQGLKLKEEQTDPRFCEFKDPTWGIRAIARIIISYQDLHNLRTVAGIINRWAPGHENDTVAYVNQVCKACGISAVERIDVTRYEVMRPLVEAIIRHENGRGPLRTTMNTWYDSATIDTALQRAGVVKQSVVVAEMIPITKEVVAASGTGAVGAVQIVDVAPVVVAAIKDQHDQLTSGEWMRVLIAVVTIGFAVFIAYSQVKKHQAGVVA